MTASQPAEEFPKHFESQLRAKIAEVEGRTEASWRDLVASNAHPMSDDYKMLQRIAMTNSGVLTGLLSALELLTGETYETEYAEKLQGWMKRSA